MENGASTWTFPGDPAVVVHDAEILGRGSSQSGGSARWTEITVIGSPDAYAIYGVGRSVLDGETDRHWFKTAATADVLVAALLRVAPGGRTATLACSRAALTEAADADEDVEAALRSWDARR